MEQDSIERRIRRRYGELAPAERRLADLIESFPGNIATYSATELAELAGVSKAAATRLFKRLGYRNYDEVRRSARDARRWGSPLYTQEQHARRGAEPAPLAPHLRRDMANLRRTFDRLDATALGEMVHAMAAARRVYALGFRNSYLLAAYLQRQLLVLRQSVLLLPAPGQTLAEDLAELGREDLLVVIGLRRRVPQLARAMQTAKEAGARILYLTDPSATRTRTFADWVVISEVEGESALDSYVSAFSVLNLLASMLLGADKAGGYAQMRRIERLHESLEELDTTARTAGHQGAPRGR